MNVNKISICKIDYKDPGNQAFSGRITRKITKQVKGAAEEKGLIQTVSDWFRLRQIQKKNIKELNHIAEGKLVFNEEKIMDEALRNPDSGAIKALGKILTGSAGSNLRDSEKSVKLKSQVLNILKEKKDPGSVAYLDKFLSDKTDSKELQMLKIKAVKVLGAINSPKARKILEKLAGFEDRFGRRIENIEFDMSKQAMFELSKLVKHSVPVSSRHSS